MAPPDQAPADDIRRWVSGLIPGGSAVNAGLDAVMAVRRWMSDRHNWVRIGYFGAGLAMIYIGAAWLAKPAVTAAVSGVTDIVVGPAKKVVKGVST